MDVEEYVRRRIADGTDESALQKSLTDRILEFKSVQPSYASAFAHAVIDEVKNTQGLTGDFFEIEQAGVHMGEFGVGSRGKGDFFAHRQIARIIGKTSASVGVDEMDDAGAVRAGGNYIICTVDGMHSRLSDYPFLAGFHVTRATLRDVYVMGAKPVMLFSDIHVADDGDVAKIFDYTAGITTVGEAMDVPLVTGSTLRIGGDMVLGNRLTGCVGAVGVADHLTARKDTRPGDVLLMTEGQAGGGTIATAAIYSGFPDVGKSTIANALMVKLLELGTRRITLLDGDHVRKHLSSELGFSREHRDLNIRRIGFVASEIAKNGGIALCAPMAPYDATRKDVRATIEPVGGFLLVWIATPIEVCEERDVKGLYAKARAGLVKEFTGISDPYEEPTDAELVIDASKLSPEVAVQAIVVELERRGYLAPPASA